MATPKNILTATNATGLVYKAMTKKTVIQNINIFNRTGTAIPFIVYRIPSTELGTPNNYNQTKHQIRYSSNIPSNTNLTYENLKFVLDVGDVISITPTVSGTYSVFIDGVEFD